MYTQLSAENSVLKFKLNNIKEHIERRLEVVDDGVASELRYIQSLISKFEQVPAGWQLPAPLVPEGENHGKENQ